MTDDEFSPETVEVRVARGAEWLDEARPGWERQIDLAVLDIKKGCQCVLGQVLGDYSYWRDVTSYQNGIEWPIDRGFLSIPPSGYPALEEAWVSLIKERFDSGLLSD